MNYISAEEFLKQPKEVQEVLINWWQPEFGDLFLEDYWDIDSIINIVGCVPINKKHFEDYDGKTHYKTDLVIPLLTEGQLIQFIESKTNRKIEIYLNVYHQYHFSLVSESEEFGIYETRESNLLQALWQVACKIAQEGVNSQKQSIVFENKYGLPVIKGGGKPMREMYNEEYR
ncbi:hypothetical protein [Clostridium botulinum]|uniref:hypothetical protein n=1 Tax=Clostridium botulinum TaxID=1491 RepID=UPI001747F11B|nr:hypothetical protein [Clostridium botulinum]MBD5589255.1 hypothetical protein [Clostridium botulinum]